MRTAALQRLKIGVPWLGGEEGEGLGRGQAPNCSGYHQRD